MPTHAENKEARRRRLMAEARRLYAEKGVETTTMEDVARAAGCTRRTLYAYCRSWEDLFIQTFGDHMVKRWKFQREAMAAGCDGLDRIRLWAQAYFAFAKDNPGYVHLEMFRDYRGIEPADHGPASLRVAEEIIDPLVAEMGGVFAAGQKDGSIRPGLEAVATLSQFAFSLRAVMNRVLSSGDRLGGFETESFVNSYIDIFLRGIANRAEARP